MTSGMVTMLKDMCYGQSAAKPLSLKEYGEGSETRWAWVGLDCIPLFIRDFVNENVVLVLDPNSLRYSPALGEISAVRFTCKTGACGLI